MSRNITVGIDIGTYHVKVVVAEYVREKGRSGQRILGTGYAESRGIRHGYIINSADASKSIRLAVHEAEKASGKEIKSAYLAVGGISLESVTSNGKAIISRADLEITEQDLELALAESEANIPQALSTNRKILHSIPVQFKIDGREIAGRPVAMKGAKLEVKTLFILCLEQHLQDLIDAVESVGVEVEDVMASPLAASLVALTKTQKIAGCVLANIGAETVSIIVYENNLPISLQIFPIGSTDITHDIALGLRIPIEEAEQIKLGGITTTTVPKKKLDEIILARLSDIFELIEAHLRKINRDGLLPAGIIITGGGSGVTTIEDLAKASLRLPSKIGTLHVSTGPRGHVIDSTWAVAYGLCIYGFTTGEEQARGMSRSLKKFFSGIGSWFKQFLP